MTDASHADRLTRFALGHEQHGKVVIPDPERTPWHAVQRAAWEALRRAET